MEKNSTEKTISHYGKNFEDILKLKSNYFEENERFLKLEEEQSVLYRQQGKRKNCKICGNRLEVKLFQKLGIDYFSCIVCGHLNGGYEDSDEFVKEIYVNEGGAKYAENYHSENIVAYQKRLEKIYIPKAQFLLNSLDKIEEKSSQLTYVDFGAGSGYFVSALKKLGITKVKGFEPSEVQVELANKMNQSNFLEVCKIGNEIPLLESISTDVISMIGVLEHLQNPIEIMSAIVTNKTIRYIYISIPMFSLTVFFELIFDKVWSRHLSGGHTHLFTEQSLEYIFGKFGLKKVAEWWFGSDLLDLYRSMSIQLKKQDIEKTGINKFEDMIHSILNPTQLEIDKKHLSSEVHLLLRKS